MGSGYLTTILFLPAVGAALIAFALAGRPRLIKWTAAIFTAIPLILAIVLFVQFDRSPEAAGLIQFEEKVLWIAALNANYHLGVDGLSLPLTLLTAFLGFLAVLISWKIDLRVREYFAWLLLLETSILGVFLSLDLLLFFIMWEIEVIPMYFLINIWGSGRKEYSAIKYVVYTLFGSAFMLAGILSIYFTTGSLNMVEIAQGGLAMVQTALPAAAIFWLLLIGFAVKLPVFPLHTWLPDAHTDAPTAVSVMLAGVLIKMGGYGMLRLCVSLFPEVAKGYALLLVILAVVNVLYGAAVTMRQTDFKRLIAYSSISHMGYVLLGIFALGQLSMVGATLQMFSHGLVTGLLFAMVGLVMHNAHERDLRQLGGLARQIPIIAVVFSIAGLASLGLPTTSGFAAEFLVFVGSFSSTIVPGIQVYTILGVLGVVVTAGYILWMLQRAFYGPVLERYNGTPDADILERVYMFAFVAVIMLVGIYPAILTDVIKLGISPIVGLLGG
ncbi:MAG TPA: NADH-quinone oxidoreductase subunit M [Dehalococcoidia bacterium]|nr:NADH-quinone oxidoreductase subunit M [Dehalococcoidia bacterium]